MKHTMLALVALATVATGCASKSGNGTSAESPGGAPAPVATAPATTTTPAAPATREKPVEPAASAGPGPATRFECGDKSVGVRMEGDIVVLDMDGARHRLKQVKTASGVRFEGQGPADMGRIVFWNKGEAATLIIGARTFPPCVGRGEVKPAVATTSKLAGTEWMVEFIDGVELEDDAQRPTIVFDNAGNVAGTTSCNRYGAPVALEGFVMTIGAARVTRMACEPALMKQEQRFLDVLQAVVKYEIRADGWLVLSAPNQRSLAARPKEADQKPPQP